MQRILAIETATKVCSVAVAEEDMVIGETSLFAPRVHAERLVIIINNLLENLKLSYDDLDAVAVSIGPGSFTGLRIGLSVAKGIAFAQDKKLISVPTLEAIAHHVLTYDDSKKIIVPILHARADEFYYSIFKFEDGELKMKTEFRVAEADEIAEELSQESILVGEGVVEFSKLVLNGVEGHAAAERKFRSNQMRNIAASARDVATIALEKFKRDEFADLRNSVPMYIKDFVAVPKGTGKGNSFKKLLEKI